MANTGGKIGEAYVELRARMDKLELELEAAKSRMNSYASAAEAAQGRAATSAERSSESIGQALKKQISGFTSLIGRVTAVVGVFTSFFQIGQRVSDMLETGNTRAENFLSTISGTDSASKVASLNKEIDALNSKLEGSESLAGRFGNLLFEGLTPSKIREQVARLDEARASELKAVNAKAMRQREAEAKAEAERQMTRLEDLVDWEANLRDDAERDRLKEAERTAKEFTEAEKRAAEELAEHRRQVGERTRTAEIERLDEMRRAHEDFNRRLFGANSFDIKQIKQAVKSLSLNGNNR